MKILSFDTALGSCSAAIAFNDTTIASRFKMMRRGHSEELLPMVDSVFKESTIELSDINLISTTIGPGAFTGIRIGVAVARGLALACGINCAGVLTTEAIAEAVPVTYFEPSPILVAIDSRRSSLFVQLFGAHREPMLNAEAVKPEYLSRWLGPAMTTKHIQVAGNGSNTVVDCLAQENWEVKKIQQSESPDARAVAAYSYRKRKQGEKLLEAKPIYLRPPDAKLPENGGRLRS